MANCMLFMCKVSTIYALNPHVHRGSCGRIKFGLGRRGDLGLGLFIHSFCGSLYPRLGKSA